MEHIIKEDKKNLGGEINNGGMAGDGCGAGRGGEGQRKRA